MTACPSREQLQALLTDHLPAPDNAAVSQHVGSCDACQAVLEELTSCQHLSHWRYLMGEGHDSPQVASPLAQRIAVQGETEDRDADPFDRTEQESLPQVPGYRIVRFLRSGGMGAVYEAEHMSLKRHDAVKVILPRYAANPAFRERFLREGQALAGIPNPHVVHVYHAGEANGVLFLAMELLRGESLADRLEREPRPPLSLVLQVGREAAEGLSVAHASGLIHRDVKPSNLWLAQRSQAPEAGLTVKLLDFGLARPVTDHADLTHPMWIEGTPDYMAPEQCRGATNELTDLYSLGIVLYQMTTGTKPNRADGLLGHAAPPPHQVNPEVPLALSRLILRLLAKEPKDRPQSASAVADELRIIRGPARRSRRWMLGVVAALAALVVGVLFFLNRNPGNARPQVTDVQPSPTNILQPVEQGNAAPMFNGKPLTNWEIQPDPSGAGVPLRNGLIYLDRPDTFLLTKQADYANVAFTAEMAAAKGTEAFVGVRLQQGDKSWVGTTSRIYDDGANMLAGMQWFNFSGGHTEHGMKRLPLRYDEFFTYRITMSGDTAWIWINGELTSGVRYGGPRFYTLQGRLGLRITKGVLKVRKLEVQTLP